MGTQEAGSTLYSHKKQMQLFCIFKSFDNQIWEKMAFIRKIKHFPQAKDDLIFQSSTCSHKCGCKLECLNLSKGLICPAMKQPDHSASQSLLQPLLEKQEDVVPGQSKLGEILTPGRIHIGTVGRS